MKTLALIVFAALCAGCATVNQKLLDKINAAITDYMAEETTPPEDANTPPSQETQPDESDMIGLLKNPDTPPNAPGSISQEWSFSLKTYDSTYRIRWPSFFAPTCGKASYTMAGPHRAAFRSYDTDNNSKRPSYTMSSSLPLAGDSITCILYDDSGSAVAYFTSPVPTSSRKYGGRLP